MSYQLGIDLGTTYTSAAICRGTDRAPSGADVVTLGTRSATVASVLYLADDGSILVGDAAERRALTDPDRVVREFKRRIGDEIPMMIGGRPYQAHELAARLTRWVVDQVSEREGGAPRRIAVTHPAAWGQHKKDLLTDALRTVGLTVTFLAEPQAAAVSYAGQERVEQGSTIAVYDLGGGTFDAAVVRKATGGTGFELLGQPEGIERLGGIDFDEVVFGHVREGLGSALDDLDPDDKDVLSAVARLRRECVEAKEALSSDTEATIPVLLPELRTQSRLTRGEFETMIRPALEETVEALRRAVGSAGLTPGDLTAVLLVGGSSRIPLVSQLVSEGLGRPVAVDADPKTAIAMGAALAISPQQRATGGAGGVADTARPGAPGSPGGPGIAGSRPGGRAAGGPAAGGLAAGGLAAGGLAAAGGGAFAGNQAAAPRPPAPPRPPISRPATPPQARPESRPAAFAERQVPPRPAVDYQGPGYAQHDDRGYDNRGYDDRGYDDRGYNNRGYDEPRRSQTGLLIGVGGVLAIAAILAAVFLWPSDTSANSDGTGSTSDLVPSESETPAPANPDRGGTPNTPKTTPKTTPKPPPATKPPVVPPPTNPPPSSPPPSSPPPSSQPPSSSPKPSGDASGGTGSTGGSTGNSASPGTDGSTGGSAAPGATDGGTDAGTDGGGSTGPSGGSVAQPGVGAEGTGAPRAVSGAPAPATNPFDGTRSPAADSL